MDSEAEAEMKDEGKDVEPLFWSLLQALSFQYRIFQVINAEETFRSFLGALKMHAAIIQCVLFWRMRESCFHFISCC